MDIFTVAGTPSQRRRGGQHVLSDMHVILASLQMTPQPENPLQVVNDWINDFDTPHG